MTKSAGRTLSNVEGMPDEVIGAGRRRRGRIHRVMSQNAAFPGGYGHATHSEGAGQQKSNGSNLQHQAGSSTMMHRMSWAFGILDTLRDKIRHCKVRMRQKLCMFGLLAAVLVPAPSHAERTLEISFEPVGDPQIAIWLETADGEFVDTLMVTRLTGTFGLGNRPGRPDFGGGYLWPYGRREMVLPIWAHRRAVQYDRIVMQDCKESWLGWHELTSSNEPFYCRPMTPSEMAVDTITCPTINFRTDKGIPLRLINKNADQSCAEITSTQSMTSLYPPRNDIGQADPARDWAGVMELSNYNDLDAVSQATPRADQTFRVSYQLADVLAHGDFVIWVEVNQEYDSNSSHSYEFFIDPALPDYGIPPIGQPSVVWSLPISLQNDPQLVTTNAYAGYGSVDGTDGDLRSPDQTISTDVEGSGSNRLAVVKSGAEPYQVRAEFSPDASCPMPPPVSKLAVQSSDFDQAELNFVSTASTADQISRYEVRYSIRAITTDEDFKNAVPGPALLSNDARESVTFSLSQLQPDTTYYVAVKSFNACQLSSDFVTTSVSTDIREFATVDACFIATAAYGHLEDDSVKVLRRFRDTQLMTNAPGRKFVELYYELSPPIADFIRQRETLKSLARWSLTPFVETARLLE
jgi:hypothetical protein